MVWWWQQDLVRGMVQLHILKFQKYVRREEDKEELQQAANNPIQLRSPGLPNHVHLAVMLDAVCRHRILTGQGCNKRLQKVNST